MNKTVNINNVYHAITQHIKGMPLEQVNIESLTALINNAINAGTNLAQDPKEDKKLSEAVQILVNAKAKHQADSEEMDNILAAIENCQQQKQAAQEEGQKAEGDWRLRLRQLRGAITDEMKQQHIQRIAQRELAGELDGLLAELELNKDRKELECSASAKALRLAHKDALVIYAQREFTRTLPLLANLARAFKLKHHALELEQNFTTQNGMFSEYERNIEKDIFKEVNDYLKVLADACPLSANNESELAEIGINPPQMNYVNDKFLSSPCAREMAFKELRAREEKLKQQGILS